MKPRKFALQPLLEQRFHREQMRRGELASAHRARNLAVERFANMERRSDAAADALGRSARDGRVREAQAYDEMLRDADGLRLRRGAEMRAHDAAVEAATAALTIANRERRVLERLRERLAARRWQRSEDDD